MHPQSIVHGFVAFTDGSVKAQLAAPDMRVPIGYALAYPDRLPAGGPSTALPSVAPPGTTLRTLGATDGAASLRYDFEPPDPKRFPCVGLAYRTLAEGGTAPAALSAANEVAVKAFVEGKIPFGGIAAVVEAALDAASTQELTLAAVRAADAAARQNAETHVSNIERTSCR